jgi:beta-glucanase (GH16 family)
VGVFVSTLPSDRVEPVGGPSGVDWEVQFDENFDGDTASLLDSGVWATGWFGDQELTQPVNSRETALLTSDNVSVTDGLARLDVTPNADGLALDDGTTYPNLGAVLNTDESQASDGFMITYGYVEARMQLPAGDGAEDVWPAFWLNGHHWPEDMEIDVVEGDGTDEGCKFNVHHGTETDTDNLNGTNRHRTVEGATTGMHTYGADIRPDGVTFYYDGEAVGGYEGEVPDAPRFLILSATTSGTMASERSLVVDHVRAWTRS